MKRFISILALLSSSAFAIVTPLQLAAVVSCSSEMNRTFFTKLFAEQYSAPKNEQGANWFNASGQLYETQIRQVFVSTNAEYRFVGVVLDGTPEEILSKMKTSRYFPMVAVKVGDHWETVNGTKIVWHEGRHTKIFCIEYGKNRP